jgi:hypothetical protein
MSLELHALPVQFAARKAGPGSLFEAASWPAGAWLAAAGALAAIAWLCSVLASQPPRHPTLVLVPLVLSAALATWIGLALRQRSRRVSPYFLIVALAFVLLAGLNARRCMYRPEGDEPWYLVMGDSILNDGDLELSAEEVGEGSRWFYGTPLPPDQIVQLRGHRRTTHWPALSVFLLPACGLRSVFLARLEMALLVAIGLGLGARVLAWMWRDERLGLASAGFLLWATPLANYSLMLFPDEAGAALFLIALAWLVTGRAQRHVVAAGLAAGGLTWLKPSFFLLGLACGLLGFAARRRVSAKDRPREKWLFGSAFAVTVLAFVAFQEVVYGQIRLYDLSPDFGQIPAQIAWSLLERGRGLLVHYPACAIVLAASGALVVVRLRALIRAPAATPGALTTLLCAGLAAGVMLLPASFQATGALGGWAPPGRYWTPVIAVLLALLAHERRHVLPWWRWLLDSRLRRRLFAATVGIGVATNLVLTLVPHIAFSDGLHWLERAEQRRAPPLEATRLQP